MPRVFGTNPVGVAIEKNPSWLPGDYGLVMHHVMRGGGHINSQPCQEFTERTTLALEYKTA